MDKEKLQKYYEHFKLLEDVLGLSSRIQDEFNVLKLKDVELNCNQQVANFLHAKTYKSSYAIITLCKEGFQEDAVSLLRTVFENVVNLLWVVKDSSGKRCEKYYEDQILEGRSFVQNNLSSPFLTQETKKEAEDSLKNILPIYEQIKKKYNIVDEPFRLIPNVADMAIDVELNHLYYLFYRPWSWQVHGKMSSSDSYIKELSNFINFSSEASYDKIAAILIPLSHLTLILLEKYCDLFSFNHSNQISELMKRWSQLKDAE
ncbi:MAG: hypothetical protein A2145_03720 [candidate division Zixibacteria bacterium RBG_16_40_9]|nr:MAG: hypothetical protein A2145_03720 [candidate division Zixibacteria bacterium RBG_16_40_9]